MKITFDPRDPQDLQDVQAFLAASTPAAAAPVAATPAAAAPVAAAPVAATPAAAAPAAPQPAVVGPSLDDVKMAMQAAIQKTGGDAQRVFDAMQKQVPGFTTLPTAAPDMFPGLIAACQSVA